jgi:tetratricopeptide (TPR) repeat protein
MVPNYNVLRETYLALLNEACFVEMLEMCERVYFEADTDGDDATAAVALLGMSNACLAGGESYKSETYARRALYFAEQSRDDRVICDALVDLGGLEVIVNGQHDTAREHLNRALTLARLIEYHEGQAGALRGIGVSYLQQRQMQLALSYLNQATAIAYRHSHRTPWVTGISRAINLSKPPTTTNAPSTTASSPGIVSTKPLRSAISA